MFERFTKDARAVVEGAFVYAEDGGARSVDAEHLLLALLDREGSRASFALSALGLAEPEARERVRRDVGEARRRAGLTRADADALAGLGIDVSEIVARVEEAHGVGAMSGDRGRGGGGAGRGGRRSGVGPASVGGARGCWSGRCGLPWLGVTGVSGMSICCWRSPCCRGWRGRCWRITG